MNGCFINRFLHTDELDTLGKNNSLLNEFYLGAFPADINPPSVNEKNVCCWIWNTDEQDEPGQHWVALFKDKGAVYFFDSYGKSIEFYNRHYWRDFVED